METSELRKAGLKATLPRLKILEILQANKDDHLSAEDVYRLLLEEDEDVGLATIYRVLAQFEDAGLVVRRHFEEGHALFELAEIGPHDHIVCLGCGKVEEFSDENLVNRLGEIAKELGYEMHNHTLVLYGQCSDDNCPRRAKSRPV
ncbi:MAG: ferric iron uptake transcriptional regulator [Salinisphaeraceae bacterium]|jgi:Fur family ferric uptake transcriptional regulator|nr:ferric iron uptake transcriptional regulator [Salinisphaeraceae bacterium]